MITTSQFVSFIEERVISELDSFAAQHIPGSGLCAIVTWGHYNKDHVHLSGPVTHEPLDATGTDVFRVFFLKEGHSFGSLRQPHLVFSLNPEGRMLVSSSLVRHAPLDTLGTFESVAQLQPTHIYSYLENHFRAMLANIRNMTPADPQSTNWAEIIMYWNEQSDRALQTLNNDATDPLSNRGLQEAVGEVFGFEPSRCHLIGRYYLTSEELVEYFQVSGFEAPEILASVAMEESILPEGLARRTDEQIIKVKGEVWEIHRYDKDPCPSNPHAHNVETGHKLHLVTGELFNYKCKPLNRKVSRAHLSALRERAGLPALPNP
jgi:hypothetical protein